MKSVFRISVKSILFNAKRTLLTLFGVALVFVLNAIICWFCSTILESARGSDSYYEEALGFVIFLLVSAFVMFFFIIKGTFDITFGGRIRLIGLLSSVGADDKQKAAVLLTETFIYAAAGSALGTFCGVELMNAAYDRIIKAFDLDEFALIGFYINNILLSIGIAVGLVSVFAAGIRPILRLSKISAVDAMKGQEVINISLSQGFFAGLAEKRFGFYGRLAGSMYDNHKAKYRAISLSLSGGTMFFITSYCLFVHYPRIIQHGREINDMCKICIILSGAFVVVFLLSSLGSAAINFDRRKGEFAMLRSLGVTTGGLCKLVLIESMFLAYYSALYGIIGSLIGDFAALLLHMSAGKNPRFGFPIFVFLAFVALDIVVCAFFSLYNIARIRKTDIISSIRSV